MKYYPVKVENPQYYQDAMLITKGTMVTRVAYVDKDAGVVFLENDLGLTDGDHIVGWKPSVRDLVKG
jgi:hypothetical protein